MLRPGIVGMRGSMATHEYTPSRACLPQSLTFSWHVTSFVCSAFAATECFCGNDVPDPDWQAGQCDSECTGNKWVACGGRHRINIFKWTNGYGDSDSDSSSDDNHNGSKLRQDPYDGATYIGCYKDSKDKRVLGRDDLDKENMTTEVCYSTHMVGAYPT